MRLVIALVFSGAPALAEPPRISIVFGADRLDAEVEDIIATRRVDAEGGGATLYIRLSPGFDTAIQALTSAHVGDTAELQICAETVLAPVIQSPIAEAVFLIADNDPARIDRLQALLLAPTCTKSDGG